MNDVPHESSADALAIRGLHKAYDHPVLQGVDLTIAPGEVVALLGANGAGKSTLAAILSGALDADGGEVSINGTPWHSDRVSLVEQQLRLDPDATVMETILRFTDRDLSEDATHDVRRALMEIGLAVLPDETISTLSDSEQRLIEIARLTVDAREIIIIDEVTATLNAREFEDLRYVVKNVSQDRGLIYITHRMQEALDLSDRVAILRDGQIHDIFDSRTSTPAELTEAMFDRKVVLARQQRNVEDTVALEMQGLRVDDHELSLDVRKGEVLGLCGARDSGIDQIMGALTGDEPGQMDSLFIAGQEAHIQHPRDAVMHRIAVVSGTDDPNVDKHFARNLLMGNSTHSENFDEELEEAEHILATLRESEESLARLLKRPAMSLGQRRWQELRTIATEQAQVLVLMEPTRGLDLAASEAFVELIDDVTSRGVAVIMSSSEESHLHALSDRILALKDGEVVAQWDPAEIGIADIEAAARGELPQLPAVG